MHLYLYNSAEAKSTNVGLISKSGDFRLDQSLRGQNTDGNLNLNFLLCIPLRLERREEKLELRIPDSFLVSFFVNLLRERAK